MARKKGKEEEKAEFEVGQTVLIKDYQLPALIISKRKSDRGDYHVYRVRRLADIEDDIPWERYYKTSELEKYSG